MDRPGWQRREVLAGASATLFGLGGCLRLSGGGSDGEPPTETTTATLTDTETPADTATETATETATATDAPVELSATPVTPGAGAYPSPYADQACTGDATHVAGPQSTPSKAWTFDVPHHPWDPLVADDTVYVSMGGWRPNSDNLHALDVASGETIWAGNGRPAHQAPAILETHLLVPSRKGHLRAVTRANGEVRWKTQIGSSGLATPKIVDGVAVLAGEERCYGVDPVDGERLWQYDLGRGTLSRAAVASDGLETPTAFFHAISDDGVRSVTALDATTGDRRWRVTDTVAYNHAPAYRDGAVYLSGPDGTEARRASDGTLLWSVDVGAETTPAVTDQRLYLRTQRRLSALEPESGDELWATDVSRLDFRRGVPGPTVTEGAVVVPEGGDADVGGYDPANGERLWTVSFPYTVTRPVSVVADALVVQSHTDETEDTAIHAYTW